jgi:hypothetical protein
VGVILGLVAPHDQKGNQRVKYEQRSFKTAFSASGVIALMVHIARGYKESADYKEASNADSLTVRVGDLSEAQHQA